MPQGHNNITINGHESIQVHVLLSYITSSCILWYITLHVDDLIVWRMIYIYISRAGLTMIFWDMQRSDMWQLDMWQLDVLRLGVWQLGVWQLGVWQLGVWQLGVWQLGVWQLDVWQLGVWQLGVWQLDVWQLGVWELDVPAGCVRTAAHESFYWYR